MNNKKDVTTNLLTPKIRKRIAQSVAQFANCNLRECENVYVNRIAFVGSKMELEIVAQPRKGRNKRVVGT